MSAINTEVDSAVRSLFTVKDYFVAEEGAAEYSVAYEARSAENFLSLLGTLKALDYSAQLYGEAERATLVVVKNPPRPPQQPSVRVSGQAFLFLLTLLSVIVTGYVLAVIYPSIAPGSSSLEMGVGFAASLMALFAARFLAQRLAAERGSFSAPSYYLPNVPLLIALPTTYFLPTFGSVSFPGTPPANKNRLFDFYLVGSIALVVVALLVGLAGAGTSTAMTPAQVAALNSGNQTLTIQTNPSALQLGVIALAQSAGIAKQVPSSDTVIFSPVEIAAWLGFLLAFFNLLPAALLDGGRMARIVLGERGSRLTTIAAGLVLLLVDLPDYWIVFLLVFLMAALPVQGETLDSISGLSGSRKAVFVLVLLVGILCIPVPQTFGTISLYAITVSQARVTTLSFAPRPTDEKTFERASPEPRAVLNFSLPSA